MQIGGAGRHRQRYPSLEQLHRAALGAALARRARVAQDLLEHVRLRHQFSNDAVAARPQRPLDRLGRAVEGELVGGRHRRSDQAGLSCAAVQRDQLLVQQRRQLVHRLRTHRQQGLVGRQLVEMREGLRTNLGVAELDRPVGARHFGHHVGLRDRHRPRLGRAIEASIEARGRRSRGGRTQRSRQTRRGRRIAGLPLAIRRTGLARPAWQRQGRGHRFRLLTTTQHLEQSHEFTQRSGGSGKTLRAPSASVAFAPPCRANTTRSTAIVSTCQAVPGTPWPMPSK